MKFADNYCCGCGVDVSVVLLGVDVVAAAACFLCLALCFLGAGFDVVADESVDEAFDAAGAGDDMVDEDELSAAKAAPPMAAANTMAGMASFKVRIKFSLVSAEAPPGAGEQIRPEPNLLLTRG